MKLIAKRIYSPINNQVKLFRNCSAEPGEPSRSVLLAKLSRPPLVGTRTTINKIIKRLINTQRIFNIFLIKSNK